MTKGQDFVEFEPMDEFMEKENNIQQDILDIQKKQKLFKSKFTNSNQKNKKYMFQVWDIGSLSSTLQFSDSCKLPMMNFLHYKLYIKFQFAHA